MSGCVLAVEGSPFSGEDVGVKHDLAFADRIATWNLIVVVSNRLGDVHQLAVGTPGLRRTLKPYTVHG
jgi:hypothetical protein